MITPYVTIEGHPEFERNRTGLGYMVMDIAKAVAKLEDVEVLATDTRGKNFEQDGVLFLKRSFLAFCFGLTHCLPIGTLFDLRKKYSMSNGTLIRLIYYWLMTGFFMSLLKKEKYDVVHIHGCSFATELWMNVCKRCNQKYIVTLHGLNSFSDTVKLESAGKQYERDFLKRVVNEEFPITVISTGMKRLIEKTNGVNECKGITVVCNSFNFSESKNKINVRQTYGLPTSCKIIVCVGNVCERKNQGQLIKAFDLLREAIARQTYILFLGGIIQPDYTIATLSTNSLWKSHFVSCGVVPKDQVFNYYEQCDAVALMSLSEGFGLSLIEGMHFGKPCISFTDVDAYEDIYAPIAMVGVDCHCDGAVAEGMECLLNTEWDARQIKEYSKKFESRAMAAKYIDVYDKIIHS